ncbi:hypothetical protein ABZP36_032715 [Zizania latifolia]
MQQRKPKAYAESAARGTEQPGAQAQAGAARDWPLEAAEEALERSLHQRKRKPAAAEKRWGPAAYVALAVFVMAVPPVVVFLGGRAGSPAVWIAAAKTLRREMRCISPQCVDCSCCSTRASVQQSVYRFF